MEEAVYLYEQIRLHIRRFFTAESINIFENTKIIFLNYNECINFKDKGIVIPVDVDIPSEPVDIYKVEFNGTQLTLWNKIKKPEGWNCIPNDAEPVWYVKENNTLMPAWNLFGNLFSLLTFEEELMINKRDIHKRFIAEYSPRFKAGLIEVPAFNESCALLVAGAIALVRNDLHNLNIGGSINLPSVILSHDGDILLGNDKWTQAVRLYRCIKPLTHLRPPALSNLRYIIENYINPKAYYFDNVIGMIELERMYNATSSFYFLNGSGGRFGSRSGTKVIPKVLSEIPEDWNIGMHYNYDTLLNDISFFNQKKELERIIQSSVVSGRAHYLRFNPERSLQFLNNLGISLDESAGYPDRIGYRCGIAGPFNPYDFRNHKKLDITELPLVIMDGTLIQEYPQAPAEAFRRMLLHLSKVGGAITVLWHPGMFYNPEVPETFKLYFDILNIAVELGNKAGNCNAIRIAN